MAIFSQVISVILAKSFRCVTSFLFANWSRTFPKPRLLVSCPVGGGRARQPITPTRHVSAPPELLCFTCQTKQTRSRGQRDGAAADARLSRYNRDPRKPQPADTYIRSSQRSPSFLPTSIATTYRLNIEPITKLTAPMFSAVFMVPALGAALLKFSKL